MSCINTAHKHGLYSLFDIKGIARPPTSVARHIVKTAYWLFMYKSHNRSNLYKPYFWVGTSAQPTSVNWYIYRIPCKPWYTSILLSFLPGGTLNGLIQVFCGIWGNGLHPHTTNSPTYSLLFPIFYIYTFPHTYSTNPLTSYPIQLIYMHFHLAYFLSHKPYLKK